VRRREFILVVGGVTAALPLAVRAQNSEQLRQIGILMGGINNPTARSLISAFEQTLKQLGWAEGSNVRIDIRWGDNNSERLAGYARELIQLKPDVILVGPTNALLPPSHLFSFKYLIRWAEVSLRTFRDRPITLRVLVI
jgi:putative ABC transport system substrate-binding protein